MLSRHMVIHIDATNANSRIRRELFSTNREGLKDGPVLEGLLQVLRKILSEDENLAKIEQELAAKLSQKETQTTDEEVRREVSKLLRDAGYRVKDPGPATEPGKGDPNEVPKHRPRPVVPDPLPTLPYPEVSRFEIVHPKPRMEVALNDNEVVLVETDADSRYDKEQRIAIRFEPDVLERASISPLRGGRMRWRVRPKENATVDQQGTIVVTLTRPNGTQITDSTAFRVLPPKVEPARNSRGNVPPFEIIPINPTDHPEKWGMVWPDLSETQDPQELASVAYRWIKQSGGIYVYYSTVFDLFASEVARLTARQPVLLDLFKRNYEIWIAYHAILQSEDANGSPTEAGLEESLERLLDEERVRVATGQVKQALRIAEITHQAMKLQAAGEE
jgi:hypothetical protein